MNSKRHALAALVVALELFPSQRVLAHDPPQGVALVWAAGAASDGQGPKVVVTNRGLIFSEEAAGVRTSSRLRCNEGLDVPTSLPPAVLGRADGTFLTGTYKSVSTTSDSACTFAPTAGLPEESLGAVIAGGDAWLLTTRAVDVPSQVFASTDEGANWSVRYTGPPEDYHLDVLVAPSRPERLYLDGLALADGTRSSLCAVSDDSGASFARKTRSDESTLFAVHPNDPDVVFAHQYDPLARTFRVLRSADACETFAPVLEGLLFAPSSLVATATGALLLGVSGTGGLYRSDDQGLSFAQVASDRVQSVTCLVQRGPRLWLCANMAPNTFGVWWSDDEANTFGEFLSFDQVEGPVVCASSAERSICAGPWYDYYNELHLFGGGGDAGVPSDAGTEPEDGGTAPTKPKGGGSGCQLGVQSARGSAHAWWLLALGLMFAWRRPRRHRPAAQFCLRKTDREPGRLRARSGE